MKSAIAAAALLLATAATAYAQTSTLPQAPDKQTGQRETTDRPAPGAAGTTQPAPSPAPSVGSRALGEGEGRTPGAPNTETNPSSKEPGKVLDPKSSEGRSKM